MRSINLKSPNATVLPTAWLRSKRWALAVALGISAIGLSGCGDDGVGSAGPGKAGSAVSANSQINFHVENVSGYDIQTVQIVDKSGQQLSKGEFKCAKGATCDFFSRMEQPGVLKFYDNKGALVGVSILTKAPAGYQAIKPSDTMMGLYVFSQLRQRDSAKPDELLVKVNRLFENVQSPDGRDDNFEELGQYYKSRVLVSGVSDDEFYKNLRQQLDAGTPLPSGEGVRTLAKSSAPKVGSSGGGECPQGMSDALNVFQQVIGFVPALPGLVELGKLGCDSTRNPDAKIDAIATKLAEIDAKLDSRGIGLDKLIDFTGTETARTAIKEIETFINASMASDSSYSALIVKDHSFEKFVTAAGGVEKAWEKEPVKMKMLLGSLGEEWGNLLNIGSATRKASLISALKLICENRETANVDWVANREKCNGFIVDYQAMVMAYYLKELNKLQDVAKTLQLYWGKEEAFISKNVTMPGKTFLSGWADWYKWAENGSLNDGLKLVSSNFLDSTLALPKTNNTFYSPVGGLPKQLVEQLSRPGMRCVNKISSSNNELLPVVSAWVTNGQDSYIDVWCRTSNSWLKSRHYYVMDGNDVMNMMGVLLPVKSPKQSTAERDGYHSDWIITIPNVAVFSTNKMLTELGSNVEPGIENGARIQPVKINEKGEREFKTNSSGYPSNGAGISKLYIRHTDQSTGLSYIFPLYFWASSSSLNRALGCLSGTCRPGEESTTPFITYKNGPTFSTIFGQANGTAYLTGKIRDQ